MTRLLLSNKSLLNNFLNITEDCIAIAVSGGIDSLALILLAKIALPNIRIYPIIVNHNLRDSSAIECNSLKALLAKYDLNLTILEWKHEDKLSNIEMQAREARYKLMTKFCKDNNINSILLGHHIQDQAETFLLRLFRGSGIKGLASMSYESERSGIKLLRPLLHFQKEELKNFLLENEIKWIEDESNDDEKFERNKIRNFLNSFENKKDIVERIFFATQEMKIAQINIQEKINFAKKEVILNETEDCFNLDYNKFISYDKEISLRILSEIFLFLNKNKIYPPRFEKLKNLYSEILNNNKKLELHSCNITIREDSSLNSKVIIISLK